MDDRLRRQLAFLVEVDRAKQVLRQNPLADGSRRENDAEHMWHLALAVLVLAEHASGPVDVANVLRMVLIHDLVEIDAGDTFTYDESRRDSAAVMAAERAAAARIFGLLPHDQATLFRDAWEEFEARATPDARLAAAVDRLLPVLLNHAAHGGAWTAHDVDEAAVRSRNAHVADGAPALWDALSSLVDDAVRQGFLRRDDGKRA